MKRKDFKKMDSYRNRARCWGLRVEEERGGIDSFCQLGVGFDGGGTPANCFLRLQPRERWKDGCTKQWARGGN